MNGKKTDIYIGRKPSRGRQTRTYLILALVVVVVATGGYFTFRHIKLVKPPTTVVIEDRTELRVFYPDISGKLTTRNIPVKTTSSDKERAEALVAALKEDKVLPSTLALTECAVDVDGTLLLNFSSDITLMKLDPVKEIQVVYSIVNTFLSAFSRAKSVQLLAAGQAFYTIGGTVYTYKPIEFNPHMMED